MRVLLISIVLLYFLSAASEALIFPSIALPICKRNTCKSSKDCNGKLKYCARFSFCKTKICINKPVKVTTTKTTTTQTTTPTTPSTTPTTKPKPQTSCPFPLENEFAKLQCRRGHKNNALCIASCKSDRCNVGSTLTRCQCKDGKCDWRRSISSFCNKKIKNQCNPGDKCKSGYRCVKAGCSKVCRKVPSPPPPPKCPKPCKLGAVKSCPVGFACRPFKPPCKTKCVKTSPVPPPQCPKACKLGAVQSCLPGFSCRRAKPPCKTECVKILSSGPCLQKCIVGLQKSCQQGYTCQAAPEPCLAQCVKNPEPAKCPVFHPQSHEPKDVKKFCGTTPLSCDSDSDCGKEAVCCYSTLCKRKMCSKKENKCPSKTSLLCNTDKDCDTKNSVCVYHSGGCKRCTRGFKCSSMQSPLVTPCMLDSDCKLPRRKCIAGEDGCLTCKFSLSTGPPTAPPICFAHMCGSDNDCMGFGKCRHDRNGCMRCQREEQLPPPPLPTCIRHFCQTNADCLSGKKCFPDVKGCKRCQAICDPRKVCITNRSCKPGEVCISNETGCKVCTVEKKTSP